MRRRRLDAPGRPAFSPRASLVLPTGSSRRGLGAGSAGLQVNLPFSKQTGDWQWHGNAGMTWTPRAHVHASDGSVIRRENLTSPFLAGSAVYRVKPMLYLMMESFALFDETIDEAGTTQENGVTLSPGFRAGWNLGDKQLVLGFAVPTTWRSDERSTGGLLYVSYELPFGR